jgi:O-antigen/teichoic acid export membrane protein
MTIDAGLVVAPAPLPDAAVAAQRHGPLTRRASLTAIASLLDYAARAGVSLVTTPILVAGLGRSIYGIWEMLGRLIGYMTATDGRPTEALRLVISQQQAEADPTSKRRAVGGAVGVWVLMFPIIALAGGVLTWLAPSFTHAPAGHVAAVRLASALLVLSFLLGTLAAIPESVLRGMNLGYKRMGLQAGLNVLGGALMVAAVADGFGLPGLASSVIVRGALTGLVFWLLVRRYVPWFGVSRPTRQDIRQLFGMSIWLSLGDLITKLNLASDVLILGAVISPAAVTTYALTSYAIRTSLGIHVFTAGAAIPGLGGVLGERQFLRAAQIRQQLLVFTWLFVTAIGSTILIWNHSFLTLWVGERFYAGPWIDLLIMVTAVQTAFIRIDAYIIDASLRPRLRVIVGAGSSVITIVFGILLTHAFGIVGLCCGVLSGRAIQTIAYPILSRSCLKEAPWSELPRVGTPRLVTITVILFAVATAAGQALRAPNWAAFIAGVPFTLAAAGGLALAIGPTPTMRRAIVGRLRSMAAGLRPRS